MACAQLLAGQGRRAADLLGGGTVEDLEERFVACLPRDPPLRLIKGPSVNWLRICGQRSTLADRAQGPLTDAVLPTSGGSAEPMRIRTSRVSPTLSRLPAAAPG